MRVVPATLFVLLATITPLHADRRKEKDRYTQTGINICEVTDENSKIHCYCEPDSKINQALLAVCWIFNGGIEKLDPVWTRFSAQSNLGSVTFNVRSDGGLDFVPTKILKYLKRLRHLTVQTASIRKIDTNTFCNLSSVREITLTEDQIVVINKHAFYNLPNLTVLTLDKNNIQEIVAEAFCELPSLQTLYLSNNSISEIQDGAFRHLVNLVDLELDMNNIVSLRNECFIGLANLQRLDLTHNKLTVIPSKTFYELWNLNELRLDHNEIFLLEQRSFDGMSQLHKLSLSHNKLVTIPAALFEGVRAISALNLRHNELVKVTKDTIQPIYDNLKNQDSYINLEDNDLKCDCDLAWLHDLRHDASSVNLRTSLENFICTYDSNPSVTVQSIYYESNTINSDISPQDDDTNQIRYSNEPVEVFHEEINEGGEPTVKKDENKRTLLQIPVDLLPCEKDVKIKPVINSSQNEARNLFLSTKANASQILLNLFIRALPLLIVFQH